HRLPARGRRRHRCGHPRGNERQHLPLRRVPEHRRCGAQRAREGVMRQIAYQRPGSVDEAVQAAAQPEAAFLAGGTSLVDLMKLEVLNPARGVAVTRIDLSRIEPRADGIRLGATATNSAVAAHPEVKRRFPALSPALLSGASPPLRTAATGA